jgi:signal transduction histidine kinase
VRLSAAHVPGGWRFEVADEGGGVPAGHEEAVFEPFYRAASVPGRPGLGLALVRSVAEAHGGSTGILNRPGVGATFWLRVPA